MLSFYTPLPPPQKKKSENLQFSDAFGGHRKRPVVSYGLNVDSAAAWSYSASINSIVVL